MRYCIIYSEVRKFKRSDRTYFFDRNYVFRQCVHTFSFLFSVLHFDNIAFVVRLRSPFEISEEILYVESQKHL